MNESTEKDWDDGLTPQERIFLLHYCSDEDTLFNGTLAYKAAYTKTGKTGRKTAPRDATCAASASRMLRNVKIKTAMRKLLAVVNADWNEENTYRSLHDIAQLATFNPADIINDDGSLKTPLAKLGPLAKCVEQIETFPTKSGQLVTCVRLAPRHKYLSMMTKILNLIKTDDGKDGAMQTAGRPQVIYLTQKIDGTREEQCAAWNTMPDDTGKENKE